MLSTLLNSAKTHRVNLGFPQFGFWMAWGGKFDVGRETIRGNMNPPPPP